MKINLPILYKKLLKNLNGFKSEEITLKQFQKALVNFRLSKKDWLQIAKELDGLKVVEFEGLNNQHAKIKVKKTARL